MHDPRDRVTLLEARVAAGPGEGLRKPVALEACKTCALQAPEGAIHCSNA